MDVGDTDSYLVCDDNRADEPRSVPYATITHAHYTEHSCVIVVNMVGLFLLAYSSRSIRSRGSAVSPFLISQFFMLISFLTPIGFSTLADSKKWG